MFFHNLPRVYADNGVKGLYFPERIVPGQGKGLQCFLHCSIKVACVNTFVCFIQKGWDILHGAGPAGR